MRNSGSQLLFVYLPRMVANPTRSEDADEKKEVPPDDQNIRDFFLEVEKMSVEAGKGLAGAVGRDCLRSYLTTELVDSEDVFVDYLTTLKDSFEIEEAQMMVVSTDPGFPESTGTEVSRHTAIARLLGWEETEATDRPHQALHHPSR